ncbi:MAG TPA: DUF2971 domain-containing protein [Opitutaceae bacterium]|nr:DUF2971 domain-containing protein [Opitutaceae bacterium]
MVLYKYFPPDRVDTLQNCRIRFTPPGSFNDPFEFRPALKNIASDDQLREFLQREADVMIDREIERLEPLKPKVSPFELQAMRVSFKKNFGPTFRALEPVLVEEVKRRFEHGFNSLVGVLCLSEVWDSILMWGHYCQSHEGFVLGFNSEHPFFHQTRTSSDDFGRLRRVHYQVKRPVVSLMGSSGLEWLDSKADIWSYEKEWRMLLTLPAATEVKNVAPGAIHLFQFPTESVLEIVLGIKCSAATESAIRNAVAGWSRRPTIFKGEIDSTDYKLNRRPA